MAIKSADKKTEQLVYTALMICLVLVGTIAFRIPVPMTQGYVHLGDAMVYLAVLTLGRKAGGIAAGLGSAMADVLGGYAFWAPWTFILKFAMAFIAGTFTGRAKGHESSKETQNKSAATALTAVGMAAGGMVMTAGYLAAEYFIYGNWGAALLGVPWNIGQFTVGIVLSLILHSAKNNNRSLS